MTSYLITGGTGSGSEEIAWAAGLFEGEGCILADRRGKNLPAICLRMTTTDLDVLEHFRDVLLAAGVQSAANIVKHKKGAPHYKQPWSWPISGDAAIFAFQLMRPYLGERRRGTGDALLAELTAARAAMTQPVPCGYCGNTVTRTIKGGKQREFCSSRCKQRAYFAQPGGRERQAEYNRRARRRRAIAPDQRTLEL